MRKVFVMIAIFLSYFIISCSSDAGTGKLPLIKLEPTNISFEDNNLFKNERSQPQYLKIKNIGEGDLKITNVFFNKPTEAARDLDYFIEDIAGVDYSNVKYPIVLKNGDSVKVKIILIPTEDGIKNATIQINSNMEGDDGIKKVNVSALDFVANLKVNESVKSGSDYMIKSENIKDLLVKECTPGLDTRTLINICNIGKDSLVISDLKLEGNGLALEYFELEQLNVPAKIPGDYTGEGNCITGLSICHNGESGIQAKLRIVNNSENSPNFVVRLESE